MRFSFIHAADLHIDSPLAALGRKNADAAARFAEAGRKAVSALIDETLNSGAKFLIIAGDIFDGDWADYTTGLFFIAELARLEREEVPVFILRGNHDAESNMSKSLSNWPANVHLYPSRKAESIELPKLQTALHGRSFPERSVPDDFVSTYPAAKAGWLNIGILHTALDGKRGHASYAPCTEDDLRRFGYDYWALGHIHKPEIVSHDPWIVFPGNIQGRSVRETGPRGAVRVSVEDGRITNVTPIVLDAARWAHETIDISSCENESELYVRIRECLRKVHQGADGRPLALRLSLSGTTALHGWLAANSEQAGAECQAIAAQIAEDYWIERLHLETQSPHRPFVDGAGASQEPDALDIAALLETAAADTEFSKALADLTEDVSGKLPRELAAEFAAVRGSAGGDSALSAEVQALLLGLLQRDRAS